MNIVIDRDSFGIIADFLSDDLQFLLFLKRYNLKPNNREIIWENLMWNDISHQELTIDFIREFKDFLDWNVLTNTYLNSEDFLREFQDYIIWDTVSGRMKFMKNYEYDFFEEFKDKLDWVKISRWGNMDEFFIVKFENELDWDILSTVQGLTEYLIRRYHDRISWNSFSRNYHIAQTIRSDAIDEFNTPVINEEIKEEIKEDIPEDNDINILPLPLLVDEDEDEDIDIDEDEDDDIQMVD